MRFQGEKATKFEISSFKVILQKLMQFQGKKDDARCHQRLKVLHFLGEKLMQFQAKVIKFNGWMVTRVCFTPK